MNKESESIWKRSWKGPRAILLWFALLAGASFVVLLCIGFLADIGSAAEVVIFATGGAALIGVGGVAAVLFIRWLCCWRNFKRFLFGVACFVTLVALAYTIENWRGKRAWEKHRQSWEAKGEVFGVKSLVPPPVPDEENFALTPLLKPPLDFSRENNQVVWHDTNGTERLRQIRADLTSAGASDGKLALGSLEKGTFADLAACAEFYRGNTNYPQAPANAAPAEVVLVALSKFDPEMRQLREAVETRPFSRFPIEYDHEPAFSILLPHLGHVKGLCTLVQLRAVARLELGRPAEALEELKVGFRLSDSISDEPLLISHLVRIATLAVNLQTVREGLARHAWTDEQLDEIQAHLASMEILAEYMLGMRGERAFSVDTLEWMIAQHRSKGIPWDYLLDEKVGSSPLFRSVPRGWFYQNILTISQMHQKFTLAAVDDKAHRVFPERAAELDTTLEQLPLRPYTFLARLLMPALSKAVTKSAAMQSRVDAALVTCALERYRLVNGKYPGTLDALTPQFVEKVPHDVIDGKPLRYRRTTDNSYVIYSIGWNKTDDGGEVVWSKGSTAGVELSKGDWVWEMPVK